MSQLRSRPSESEETRVYYGGWLLHGLEAVERVIEHGILRKQFLEAIRVMKLEYYGRAKEHYANLIKDREVTLDFLGNLRGSFFIINPF